MKESESVNVHVNGMISTQTNIQNQREEISALESLKKRDWVQSMEEGESSEWCDPMLFEGDYNPLSLDENWEGRF